MSARGTVVKVAVYHGGMCIRTDAFAVSRLTIGRDARCDLVLDDSSVSRVHAHVESDGEQLFIRDNNSSNGLFVNGTRIKKAELDRSDKVRIGEFALKLELQRANADADADAPDDSHSRAAHQARRGVGSVSNADEISGPGGRGRGRRDPPSPLDGSVTQHDPMSADSYNDLPFTPGSGSPPAAADSEGSVSRPTAMYAPSSGFQLLAQEASKQGSPGHSDEGYSRNQGMPAGSLSAGRRGARQDPNIEGRHSQLPTVLFDQAIDDIGERGVGALGADSSVARTADLNGPDHENGEANDSRRRPGNDDPRAAGYRRRDEGRGSAHGSAKDGAHEREDEDEEHDADDEPAEFSLLSSLLSKAVAGSKGSTHVEIITERKGRLVNVTVLRRGESLTMGYDTAGGGHPTLERRRKLVDFAQEGFCWVYAPSESECLVTSGGVKGPAPVVDKRTRVTVYELAANEMFELTASDWRYHIRYVSPPEVESDSRPSKSVRQAQLDLGRSMAGSLAGHLCLVFIGLFLPAEPAASSKPEESFADVSLSREMTLDEPAPPEPPKPPEPPPPPPPPLKIPPPKTPPAALKKVAQLPPSKQVPKDFEAAPTKLPPKPGGTSKEPPGVLGLLTKTGSSAAPGPAAALAAASNLSAANAPAGTGGFHVSGLARQDATDNISLGGGGELVTRGTASLLRGGGGGAGALSGNGTRKVGGMVTKVPGQMRSAGEGTLDRDLIQRVINENIGQIQRCYERELVRTPGLSGKLEVEWVIGTSGMVRSARQKYSDLDSSAAVSCVLDKIKGWRFPQPKGGEVAVSYPFVFKSINY